MALIPESNSTDQVYLSAPASAISLGAKFDEGDKQPAGTSSKRSSFISDHRVPRRDSSLRHSFGSASASASKRRASRQSEPSTLKDEIETNFDAEEATRGLSSSPSKDVQQDPVSRRIQELKDQKKRRESSLVLTPSESIAIASADQVNHPRRALDKDIDLVENDRLEAILFEEPPTIPTLDLNFDDVIEDSAPSPVIGQSTDRLNGSRVSSISGKARIPSSTATQREGLSASRRRDIPGRTNSKLLKRLSRPMSPNVSSRRRTVATDFSQLSNASDARPQSADSIDDDILKFLFAPRFNQTTTSPQDGRLVSFSEVGDPNGSAVFVCVGMGLTRYVTAFYDELAATLKLRLITPDRPGVGGSDPGTNGEDTPLAWPEDVRAICQHLKITKFSLVAHSAGAIYALATALRIPQHIRGRLHLLAPWIPPSQLSPAGAQDGDLPGTTLPYSQRILRSLPATFLKAANSSFLTATSTRITTSLPKSPRRAKRNMQSPDIEETKENSPAGRMQSPVSPKDRSLLEPPSTEALHTNSNKSRPPIVPRSSSRPKEKERQDLYDTRLTGAIWEAATTGANPAVDLIICLERHQQIGFRYVDVRRSVVIHHGSKDNRVPVENVEWLGRTMRRCEVRILEGEGHGLMASPVVMGNVLMEMAREWEDWNRVTKGRTPPRNT